MYKLELSNSIIRPIEYYNNTAIPVVSWSLEYEDMAIYHLFKNKPKGFYIDIGANTPFLGSNTKIFYDKGWNGINVDANPENVFDLAKARTRDINLNFAITDKKGSVETLYVTEQKVFDFMFGQSDLNMRGASSTIIEHNHGTRDCKSQGAYIRGEKEINGEYPEHFKQLSLFFYNTNGLDRLKTLREMIYEYPALKYTQYSEVINQLNDDKINELINIVELDKMSDFLLEEIMDNLENIGMGHFNNISYKIPTTTLEEIFKLSGNRKVDFLSVDVEGAEYLVFKGSNLKKYQPSVILLESNGQGENPNIFLEEAGYKFIARVGMNLLFIKNSELSNFETEFLIYDTPFIPLTQLSAIIGKKYHGIDKWYVSKKESVNTFIINKDEKYKNIVIMDFDKSKGDIIKLVGFESNPKLSCDCIISPNDSLVISLLPNDNIVLYGDNNCADIYSQFGIELVGQENSQPLKSNQEILLKDEL